MSDQRYAVLPLPGRPARARACPGCDGRGVTGERYEMPAGNGPVLLAEVICPDCGGCGNGDPGHPGCAADDHAYPDEHGGGGYEAGGPGRGWPDCPSCGTGRGWNAVQGFTGDEHDELAVLRVPCGCSEGRLKTGTDPASL